MPVSATEAGIDALRRGNPHRALEHLHRAVWENPRDAHAYGYLGVAYGALRRHQEAVSALTRAVDLAPTSVRLAYNLGHALEEAGRPDDARLAYRRALELDPGYKRAIDALERLTSPAEATPTQEAPEQKASAEPEQASGATRPEEKHHGDPAPEARGPRSEPTPPPAAPGLRRRTGYHGLLQTCKCFALMGVVTAVANWGVDVLSTPAGSAGSHQPVGPVTSRERLLRSEIVRADAAAQEYWRTSRVHRRRADRLIQAEGLGSPGVLRQLVSEEDAVTRARHEALSRDQARYRLAEMYLGQDRPKEAAALLRQVLESQRPNELGEQAQLRLEQIGER